MAGHDLDRRARLAGVAGLGYYLPEGCVTNEDLSRMVDTSDEWIVRRTGIHSRHRAGADQTTSDLATRAAKLALADAQLPADRLDLIIVATVTPDEPVPAAACLVQTNLGANAPALDVNAGCTGALYGLHLARAAVESGTASHVLVIGAEILTRITDYRDRRSCVLFGDGAGAMVVAAGGRLRLLASVIGADGTQSELIHIPGGGSLRPASADTVAGRQHYLQLDGQAVFRHAVRRMAQAANEALDRAGLTAADVSRVVPHQANERIIDGVASELGLPADRVVHDLGDTGNTSSASVPIALARARDVEPFASGEIILLVAFGAGLTWGCQVMQVMPPPADR